MNVPLRPEILINANNNRVHKKEIIRKKKVKIKKIKRDK